MVVRGLILSLALATAFLLSSAAAAKDTSLKQMNGKTGKQLTPDGSTCTPLKAKNLKIRVKNSGKLLYFKCRRRYQLYGAMFSVCRGGLWSHPPPVCVRAGCPGIHAPRDAPLHLTYSLAKALATFSCTPGFSLEGAPTLTCDGKRWSDVTPRCQAVTPQPACDFETEDLCGWTNSDHDKFDWTWQQGATPTRGTGPRYDHTLGEGSKWGHYVYIETSGTLVAGYDAKLVSPVYTGNGSDICFDFWYHAYGQLTVGSLAVHVVTPGVVDPGRQDGDGVSLSNRIFFIEGNQEDLWHPAQARLPPITGNFQIIFVARRSMTFFSDIAVDDVSLAPCVTMATDATATLSTEVTAVEQLNSSTMPAAKGVATEQRTSMPGYIILLGIFSSVTSSKAVETRAAGWISSSTAASKLTTGGQLSVTIGVRESSTAGGLPPGVRESSTAGGLPPGVRESNTAGGLPPGVRESSTASGLPPGVESYKDQVRRRPSLPVDPPNVSTFGQPERATLTTEPTGRQELATTDVSLDTTPHRNMARTVSLVALGVAAAVAVVVGAGCLIRGRIHRQQELRHKDEELAEVAFCTPYVED